MNDNKDKLKILQFAKKIFPYNRSITGNEVRKTLLDIKKIVPELNIFEIKSGTKVFDWIIPKEWNVKDAWIKNSKGEKIIDYKKNNLHLVSYSKKINKKISLSILKKYLHTIKNNKNAIPYVTSYYKNDWGFCIKYKDFKKLKNEKYHIFIDSNFKKGSLTYGEILFKGKTKKEILISTYICHPSMANNETSGIAVVTFLTKWIKKLDRKYSYRIIFIPETIGAIAYINKNLKILKKNVIAGYVVTCVGDNRNYSFLPSKNNNTLSNKIAKHVLKWHFPKFKEYSWLDRGSDERQFCAPGVDLPIASIMRTKYGKYKEYHTSLDNFKNVVSADGLIGSLTLLKLIIKSLETNCIPLSNIICEPFLTKYNLYPKLSNIHSLTKGQINSTRLIMHIISYSDGKVSLLDIADKCNVPIWEINKLIETLKNKKIIKIKSIQ